MASSLTTSSQIGEKWNQVYVPTTDAKEAEVDWFYEDVQHLVELTSNPPPPQISLSS